MRAKGRAKMVRIPSGPRYASSLTTVRGLASM